MRANETLTYERASTDQQDKSPTEQRHICEQYHVEQKLPPLCQQRFTDLGQQGDTHFGNRPDGRALLDYVQRGDAFVVCELDRLGRDPVDQIATVRQLVGMGVEVHILDMPVKKYDPDNPASELILTICAGMARFFLMAHRKRVKSRRRAMQEMGFALTKFPPIGMRKEPNPQYRPHCGQPKHIVTPDINEEGWIAYIAKCKEMGWSIRRIVMMLGVRGAQTSSGTPWTRMRVQRVCEKLAIREKDKAATVQSA